MAKKKDGGSGGISGILIAILIPVLVIVLIGSFLFSIFETIVDFIVGIVADFLMGLWDFLTDPIGTILEWKGNINNFFAKLFDDDNFDPTKYENLRTDPVVVVSDEKVQETIDALEKDIDTDIAGLDKLMLKKIVLANYRGLYLDDTNVLVELTKEDFNMSQTEWNNLFRTYKDYSIENIIQGGTDSTAEGALAGLLLGHFIPGVGNAIGMGLGALSRIYFRSNNRWLYNKNSFERWN